MGFSSILKSAAGTRPFCHQKAVILSRRTYQAGWNETINLAA